MRVIGAIAVAIGRFYAELAERLVAGAQRDFAELGGGGGGGGGLRRPRRVRAAVRGLPPRGDRALRRRRVPRGGHPRGDRSYDYVCTEAARGIQAVRLRTGVPCAFGVLTVPDLDQARARTGGGKGHQGHHAADAVATMARMREALGD